MYRGDVDDIVESCCDVLGEFGSSQGNLKFHELEAFEMFYTVNLFTLKYRSQYHIRSSRLDTGR